MPREAYTRPKSVHSRGSGNMDKVRVRHPEFPDDSIKANQESLDQPGDFLPDPDSPIVTVDSSCVPAADTACYLLDGFDRTVAAAGRSNAAGAWSAALRNVLVLQNLNDGVDEAGVTDPLVYAASPFQTSSYSEHVSSYVGTSSYAWTARPSWSSCGGIKTTFVGWRQNEVWYEFVVPAHPADMASLLVGTFEIEPQRIYAWQTNQAFTVGNLVVVSSTEPVGIREGSIVGVLTEATTGLTVQVPGGLIPAAGATLYVGVIPGYVANFGTHSCGFIHWPRWNGDQNSGSSKVYFRETEMQWEAWDAQPDAWGSILSDDDNGAWWRGNLPWEMSKTGGVLSMDGNSLKFVVTAGSTETLVAEVQGTTSPADDDTLAYGEPWSHPLGVRAKVRFKVTTAGSLTEAGERFFSIEWADGKDIIRGTAHIGDIVRAEGVSVDTEDGFSYLAKAIDNGSWMWLTVDSRHGDFIRGKMWAEAGTIGGGEGAAVDVTVTRVDTSENPSSLNYFRMTASIGNVTGADQTLWVERILFCGPGEDCEWVTEKIGEGDGVTVEYTTSQAYKKGMLWFFVDGFHVRTVDVNRANGEFTAIEPLPADTGANLIARYVVDLDTDDTT